MRAAKVLSVMAFKERPVCYLIKEIFSNGFLHRNPLLMYAIGVCPIVAVTTTLRQAVAISIVTVITTIVICMLTNLIFKRLASWLRVALYFLCAIGIFIPSAMLVNMILPMALPSLGVFMPLLVVNTLYLYRSEGYARKNKFLPSFFDSLFTSLGYSLAVCIFGALREIITHATIWNVRISFLYPITAFANSFGGFIILGFVAALFAAYSSFVSSRRYVTINFDDFEDEEDDAYINELEKSLTGNNVLDIHVISEETVEVDGRDS